MEAAGRFSLEGSGDKEEQEGGTVASIPREGVDWGWGPLSREPCVSVKLLGPTWPPRSKDSM